MNNIFIFSGDKLNLRRLPVQIVYEVLILLMKKTLALNRLKMYI